jgi:hypothetical protein
MVLAENLFQMTLMDTRHVKEEIYILGATILGSPRGPLCSRRDAPEEKFCVNIPGFLGLYGKSKDTPKAREDQKRHKG